MQKLQLIRKQKKESYDSVEEVRKLRWKLSKEPIDLKELNSYAD